MTTVSIDGEAVEQSRAAGGDQSRLTEARAGMGRIPRRVAAAGAVGMAELRLPRPAARPIVAGVVGIVRIRTTIGPGAGQHVMRVGHVAEAVDDSTLFVERR